MKKIGIIGYGVVGKAVHNSLPNETEVEVYDPALGFDYADEIGSTDAVFICVPTPTKEDKQDISIIKQSLDFLSDYYIGLVIIKSTILPENITKLINEYPKLWIMHAPEFLDQSSPYFEQTKHILGVTDIYQAVEYKKIFRGKDDYYFRTTNPKTAAMIKYVHNVYGSLKVTFFNEVKDVCDKDKIDYREMLSGMLSATDHIGATYTTIGADGKRGFGGACFPKDSVAFANQYNIKTLNSAINKNFEYREKEMKEVSNASKTCSNCSCKNGK